MILVGGFWREDDLLGGCEEDFDVEEEGLFVDVEYVVVDVFFEEGDFGDFVVEIFVLGEVGDVGFYVVVGVVIVEEFCEFGVVFDYVWVWVGDIYFIEKDV